ncbi:fasciclin domain-containing protein [Winogradskyella aurantiaca]|uniref:fasciclin domain-containing protein n=1 Tax=Winogradskyella aurantiaca TaxID=2219558 RepID=UPI001300349A|nr:fasciclin domain-containing protein [Winogradskyella aurantiaca]
MKIISKMLKLLPVFLLVLGLTGCGDDDELNMGPGVQTTTVVDVALDNDLNILAAALISADLVTTLEGTGPFTVFGPTDTAFQNLLDSNPAWNGLEDIDPSLLRNVLLNHVIIGSNISSSDLVTAGEGYAITAGVGPNESNLSLYYNTSNGVIINGSTEVTNADNEATNGVVHIVNEVILPPTIATFATANPALENLVSALALADTGDSPTVPWISTVSSSEAGPLTVFAPTNDAFADLLMELDPSGMTGLGDLDPGLVDTVLTLHVLTSNTRSTGLSSGTLTTLGGNVTLDANNLTITDANGRVSNIIVSLVDIQGANGVVHVIDKVVLPELEMSNNIIDVAIANDFIILAQALTLVEDQTENDLVSLLQSDGPFTVFAPSDQAFQDLLDSNDEWSALTDIPIDVLTNVLLNHVIVGAEVMAEDLIQAGSGYTNTTAIGPDEANLSLYYNVVNDVVQLNGGSSSAVGANVTTPNVGADNGVIHVIDKILLPPTVVDFALANPALTNLVAALGAADGQDPSPELTPTLSGTGPFTVFAPTDGAFADLLQELEVDGLGDLDAALVEDVLLMHVVADNVRSSELSTGAVPVLGGSVQLDANALTIEDPNGRESNIVIELVDIQGANGVVHVIDRVILPEL